MPGWTKEALGRRVDAIAERHQGDEFVAAVETFGRELDRRERSMLYDVLMERAKLGNRIGQAARERIKEGWTRRLIEGRLGRRRLPSKKLPPP